jgi:uncharacterized surface protein with fasciclin (FAS1) repeats
MKHIKTKITIIFVMIFVFTIGLNVSILESSDQDNTQFICQDEGTGLSAIDVLEITGQHATFLSLLEEHDQEGYDILADPLLADKTIWAPIDSAFEQIEDALESLSSEEIKEILGYHISPPLSRPNGEYPIITFDYIRKNKSVTYRTRTGVLTGSDQRITSTYEDEVYKIENATILSNARCTQAGSVFSIDQVITNADHPSWFTKLGYQTVRILLYDDIRFVIYSTLGAVMIGTITAFMISRRKRKEEIK